MFTVADADCGRGNRRVVEDEAGGLGVGIVDMLLCLLAAALGAATGWGTSVRRGAGGEGVSLDLFVTYVWDHLSVALLMDPTGFHCKAGAAIRSELANTARKYFGAHPLQCPRICSDLPSKCYHTVCRIP